MSQDICFIAFGTFGNPNGFKQTFFIGGNAEVAKSIKTFDLKTDAIRLFPKSRVYCLRKEVIQGNNALSYSIYTYAKEPGSDRGGTFIGSSILYLGQIADEGVTISCLNEFHDKLVGKNVRNDVISVNHSDRFVVSKPGQYETLVSQLREIDDLNFSRFSNKNLVVYSEVSADKLQPMFTKALPLLDVYDAIYFTASQEVAEFVHQKNLFHLVQADGFAQELAKLQEERKQHTLLLTAAYKTEKEKLEEDKKKILSELKEQIDTSETIHQQNKSKLDEWKQELIAVTQKYEGYAKKIDDAVQQLASGKKADKVRQLLAENKRIFIESVNEQKKPVFINTIPKPKVKTDMKPIFQPDTDKPEPVSFHSRHRRQKEYRLDRFKVASFVLLLLWIGTLVYFLFVANKEIVVAELPKPELQAPVIVQLPPVPDSLKLNPQPNGKLTGTALHTVIKKLTPHTRADSVVKLIFDNNPDAIRRVYASQAQAYTAYLVEQNKDYFEKKDSAFYLNSDTLATVPSYKQP